MTPGEVWSVVESVDGRPHETATKLATEARRLGDLLGCTPCCVFAAGLATVDAAVEAAGEHGVDRVYLAAPSAVEAQTAEVVVGRLAALAAAHGPRAIVFAATRDGAEWAARLAARLRVGLAAGCVDFERDGETLLARRVICGRRAHATVRAARAGPLVATVDLRSLAAVARPATGVLPEVVRAAGTAGEARVARLRRWRLAPSQLDLAEAHLIVGVGRPVDTPAALALVQQLADRLGASLGGSRIAHFQGVVPKARQIGASGKWISPDVYLTLGISGASYHLLGIKGAKHVIAVNTDSGAPIFKVAELGIVAGYQEVVAALLAALADEGRAVAAGSLS